MLYTNTQTRVRLRDFAKSHKNLINVKDFIMHANDEADFGMYDPICLPHTRTILSRSPEFVRVNKGVYKYEPKRHQRNG